MRWATPPAGPDGAEITNTAPSPATTPATEFGSHDQRSTTAVLATSPSPEGATPPLVRRPGTCCYQVLLERTSTRCTEHWCTMQLGVTPAPGGCATGVVMNH